LAARERSRRLRLMAKRSKIETPAERDERVKRVTQQIDEWLREERERRHAR